MSTKKLQILGSIPKSADDVKAVSYDTAQTLTDEQKAQARDNIGAMSSDTTIPSKTSDLTNDSGFLTSYTETDPTVPAWAKEASKPSYTADEVGAAETTHASKHASDGSDPITPASIGAATMDEVNTAIQTAIQNSWEASY